MMRENHVLGAINVSRATPGAFTDKQIALLKTFADQAVIAIENVRLFKELQARNAEVTESLEQQTATAEILKVISSSPTDTQPVFEAIIDNALRLCDAQVGRLQLYDGENSRVAANRGERPEFAKWVAENPLTLASSFGLRSRLIAERQPIHVLDMREHRSYREGSPLVVAVVELNEVRSALIVPMLKEDGLVGSINVNRREVRAFTQKQIDLISTFASQAVIAIENVRLFKEIQDKSTQLEIASRHKSEFLASMSHELRTPLNAILGFNEMIIHEMYGEVPPDMKVPLEDVQSSGKHLLRLINNVLDLAKIEAGRMELALADYSIVDTAESVRSTLRSLAAEKGLEFVVTVPNDMPLVYGDSGRILQCLVNLAGNALKFTKAGQVEISAHHHDGMLTCCVSDTGVGIPPDKIGGLFTEFKQTDATIASEYGGTGLGLSITKQFIEMHGGRIWVESVVGQGSRFIFEIPLRAAAPANTEANA
jgi:signal transduction histidine kinase